MIPFIEYRPSVTSSQSIIGTEKYPDAALLLNYDDDDYSQRYGQIKETFRALTKNDILKPCTSNHDLRSTNVNAAGEATSYIGFN